MAAGPSSSPSSLLSSPPLGAGAPGFGGALGADFGVFFGALGTGMPKRLASSAMASLAWALEVTSMDTTAGATRSKISAKDMGLPGGGAKLVPGTAWFTGGRSSAMAWGHWTPAPTTASAATLTPASAPATKPFFITIETSLVTVRRADPHRDVSSARTDEPDHGSAQVGRDRGGPSYLTKA